MREIARRYRCRRKARGRTCLPPTRPQREASGNVKLKDIGPFLRAKIETYFKAEGIPVVMRYFDPSYQVRSRRANARTRYSAISSRAMPSTPRWLARPASSSAFCTSVSSMSPSNSSATHTKRLDPASGWWRSVLAATGNRSGSTPMKLILLFQSSSSRLPCSLLARSRYRPPSVRHALRSLYGPNAAGLRAARRRSPSIDEVRSQLRTARRFRYYFNAAAALHPAGSRGDRVAAARATARRSRSGWPAKWETRNARYVIGKAKAGRRISHAWLLWSNGGTWIFLDPTDGVRHYLGRSRRGPKDDREILLQRLAAPTSIRPTAITSNNQSDHHVIP